MGKSDLLVFLLLAGCVPTVGNPASLITKERIIGVRAEPAEAAPGDMIEYTSLVVSPLGTVDAQNLSWSLCNLREPVAENTPVSQACLTGELPQAALGNDVSLRTPSSACVSFGPLAPPSSKGTLRPTDPDATGGYYQPIRLDRGAQQAIFRERLRCDLAGASLLMSQEFRTRYPINQNPKLAGLTAFVDGNPIPLDSLPASQRISLAVDWLPDSTESYPVFDSASQTIADHREALWVSWYVTAGGFDDAVTGRGENDSETSAENLWQSPSAAGAVFLWLVLHDSRGGADFALYTLTVAL